MARMLPAEQRLEAPDPAARQLDLRLIVDRQLVGRQSMAKIRLQRTPDSRLQLHAGLAAAMPAAPLLLGAPQRQIGARQEVVDAIAAFAGNRDPDAGIDRDRLGTAPEWATHDLAQLVSQRHRRGGLRPAPLQNRELVAGDPRDQQVRAQIQRQALRQLDQHAIGEGLAVVVIDRLEAVQIEGQKGQRRIDRGGILQGQAQVMVHAGAIGQSGQGIAPGQCREALLSQMLRLPAAPAEPGLRNRAEQDDRGQADDAGPPQQG